MWAGLCTHGWRFWGMGRSGCRGRWESGSRQSSQAAGPAWCASDCVCAPVLRGHRCRLLPGDVWCVHKTQLRKALDREVCLCQVRCIQL